MMTGGIYAESSAVLRWLLGHTDATIIAGALAAASEVVTSALTQVEVCRTLQRLVVGGQLKEAQRAAIWRVFIAAARHWRIHAVTEDLLRRAADPFPIEPVRTLDALHLATALSYLNEVAPVGILSTDDRIRQNAGALGLPVLPD
jgi:predicted nucleic acid-binding protein